MLQYQLKTQQEKPFFEIMRLLFDRCPYNPEKNCSTSEFLNFSHLSVENILNNVVLPSSKIEEEKSSDSDEILLKVDEIEIKDKEANVVNNNVINNDENDESIKQDFKEDSEDSNEDEVIRQDSNIFYFLAIYKNYIISFVTIGVISAILTALKYYKKVN